MTEATAAAVGAAATGDAVRNPGPARRSKKI
jgi:hypothetical protein